MDLRRHDGRVVRSGDPGQPQVTPASPGRARRRRWGALTVFALAGCNGPAAVRDAGTGEAGSMEGGMDEGTDGDLPPEMTSLPVVTPLTETLIRLTWEAGSDDVTAAAELTYHVYRATSADGLDFTVAPSLVVPKGVTTADVVGLSPTQENFFVVRAVDGTGQESENTAPVSGQTPDLTAPVFEGLGSLAANEQGGLDAAWVAATDNVVPGDLIEYDLYLDTEPQPQNDPENLAVTVIGDTSVTVDAPPLVEAQQYFAVVRARDAAGNDDGNVVAQLATTRDVTAPSFGGVDDVATVKGGIIALSWAAASDTVTTDPAELTYLVYGAPGTEVSDFGTPHDEVTGVTSYDFIVGATETEYTFVVRARDAAGNVSDNVESVTATTGTSLDGTPPVMSTVVVVNTVSATSLAVAWDKATDDHEGGTPQDQLTYGIWVATTPDGHDFDLAPVVPSPDPSAQGATLEGLEPDTIYYVVVRARDLGGNWSENESPQSGLTDPDTTPPSCAGMAFNAVGETSTSNKLTWMPAADDASDPDEMTYRIYRSASSLDIFDGNPIASIEGTGADPEIYPDLGLTPEQSWYYGIEAVDKVNHSCAAPPVAFAITLADTTPPTFAGVSLAEDPDEVSVSVEWPEITTDDAYTHDDMVYVIYWSETAGDVFVNPAGVQVSPPAALSETVTGLQPDRQYFIGVHARDPYGNEDANTVEVSFATLADTVGPSVPGSPQIETVMGSAATVSWAASADPKNITPPGELTYELCGGSCLLSDPTMCPDVASLTSNCEWYTSNPVVGAFEPSVTPVPTPGGTSGDLENLAIGANFYVQVRACDASQNCSAWSPWLFGSTSQDAVPPTEGVLTEAEGIGPASILVTWTPGSDDVSGTNLAYRVFAVPAGQAFDLNATPGHVEPPSSLPLYENREIVGLARETTYDLLVQSQDAGGNWSTNTTSQGTAITLADTIPPDPPAIEGLAEVGCATVDVTVALVEDIGIPASDQIVYEICASQTSDGCDGAGFDGNIVGTATGHDVAQGAHTERVTVDGPGTWYIAVRARDDAGNLSAGSAAVGVTLTDTVGPVFLGPVTVAKETGPDWAAKLTATWVAATDACADGADLRYEVCLDDDPNEPTIDCVNNFTALAPAATALTLSVEDPLIESYTRYWMYVRALDPSGNASVVQVGFATSGVSYVNDIEPIFNQTVDPIEGGCAATCHAGLADVTDYWTLDNVKGVTATCNPSFQRVAPGDPCTSLVWLLTQPDGDISCNGDTVSWPAGCPGGAGAGYQMPQFGPHVPAIQETLYWWIDEGAHDN